MASTREDLGWRAVTLVWVTIVGTIWITLYLLIVGTIAGLLLVVGIVIGRDLASGGYLRRSARNQMNWYAEQWKWALFGGGDGWWYPIPGQRSKR